MSENLIESKNTYYELMKTEYPQMSKLLLIIHILLKNPEGATFKEITKITNCNTNAIYSILKRIRQHKTYDYSVMSLKHIARISVSGNKPTETDIQNNIEEIKNYSLTKIRSNNVCGKIRNYGNYEKLISILKNNPNGISIKTIKNELKTSGNKLYTMIFNLKKKGFQIESIGGNYITTHVPDSIEYDNIPDSYDNIPKKKLATIIPNSNNSLLNENTNIPSLKKHIERIANLPEQDRIDFYDMIKKSIYYQKSSIALIEANEAIIQLNNQVTKGKII
jgi:biotin operon repressor